MIRTIFCSLMLLLGASSSVFSQDLIQISSVKPAPGEEIRVSYLLEDSQYHHIQAAELVVYLMLDEEIRTLETSLRRENKGLVGAFKTTPETKAIFIKVVDKDGEPLSDLVKEQLMYDKKTGNPIPGAYLKAGFGFYYQFSLFGIEQDMVKGEGYIQKEFELYPDSKLNPIYMAPYSSILFRQRSESRLTELRGLAEALSKKRKEEDKLLFAHHLYRNLGALEETKKLEKLMRKKFPKGTLVKRDLQEAFYQARGDMDAMEKIYAQLERLVDLTDRNERRIIDNFSVFFVASFGEVGNWKKLDKYLHTSADPRTMANVLNNLAWTLVGPDPEESAPDLDRAAQYSKMSIDFLEKELASPSTGKPSYMTNREWTESLNDHIGFFSNTYALVQYKLGNYQQALEYQEKTLEQPDFLSQDMYERHVTYFYKVKGPDATEALLANYIQDNNANLSMREEYKRLFLANNTVESAFEKHIKLLNKESDREYQRGLKEKMLDLPAPDFLLTNIHGEKVSLRELRGKVVILDFWATWCNPCKASFPAMQIAVDKYKDNDKVIFLFINSWEETEDKLQSASAYITANNFSFNVPMDLDNQVIESYEVEGIPTKFIIDPNGRIRFRGVGYNGDDEQYVRELEMMINLALQ